MANLSPELGKGLLALDQTDGYKERDEPRWCPEEQVWWWPFSIQSHIAPNPWLTNDHHWILRVDGDYPLGEISIYPAMSQGLVATFPHQLLNSESRDGRPWRTGKLCLSDFSHRLGNIGIVSEPQTAEGRLRWNLERLGEWLFRASRGELLAAGDPFELPDLPPGTTKNLAFNEDKTTLDFWNVITSRRGIAKVMRLPEAPDTYLVQNFQNLSKEVILEITWGRWARKIWQDGPAGGWIRFNKPIIQEPWQAPETWLQFRTWCKSQGLNLDEDLRRLSHLLRRPHEALPWILLLGFPIDRKMGDAKPARMHWLALEPPNLAPKSHLTSGFRKNSQKGLEVHERKLRTGKLPWLRSTSWSREDLGSRGHLPITIRNSKILLIGLGALGSQIAELLARGGVQQMVLLDPDILEAGNLVRHSLSMNEVGSPKVEGLTERLASISPHIEIRGIQDIFPTAHLTSDDISDFDIVFETTGEDSILSKLGQVKWQSKTILYSLSIGLGARRLYGWLGLTSDFKPGDFHSQVNPWLEKDRETTSLSEVPWEGIGCWHPVFPARQDDISLLTAVAFKEMVWRLEVGNFSDEVSIWEQEIDEQGWLSGVSRKASDDLEGP